VLKIPLEKLEQKDHVEKPVGSQHPSFLRQMEATASNLRELLAGKQASSKLEAESLENEVRLDTWFIDCYLIFKNRTLALKIL